jgi:hypothetical protein
MEEEQLSLYPNRGAMTFRDTIQDYACLTVYDAGGRIWHQSALDKEPHHAKSAEGIYIYFIVQKGLEYNLPVAILTDMICLWLFFLSMIVSLYTLNKKTVFFKTILPALG